MKFLYLAILSFLLAACQSESTETPNHEKVTVTIKDDASHREIAINEPKPVAPFVSKAGRFSVQFPTEPTTQKKKINSPDVGQIALTQYLCEKEGTKAWLVSFSDYPAQMIKLGNNQKLLKGIRNQILQSLGTSVESQKEIMLADKYEGLSFTAHAPRQKMDVVATIYLVKNRLYQLIMFSSVGKFAPTEVDGFMNSFQLTELQKATEDLAENK